MSQDVASPRDKPILDEETFQQLLAAAHTLQEQQDLLVEEAGLDCVQTANDRIAEHDEPVKVVLWTPGKVGPTAFHASATPQSKPFSLRDELFWKVAIVVAVSAVSALLLVASFQRFSPLPAGLSSTLEVAQPQAPFQSNKNIVGVPAQDSSLGTN